jgi:circadian clock protein KaiC
MTSPPNAAPNTVVSSGIPGLDAILDGGLVCGRAYQVRGLPGTGKTILSWYFLTGPNRDAPQDAPSEESSLLITFDEPEHQLRADAARLGFDTGPVDVLDLSPTSDKFVGEGNPDNFYSTGNPSLGSIAGEITDTVDATTPTRIVVDSMSHFRQFVAEPSQDRIQVLSLLRYLKEEDATVLLLSEGGENPDGNLDYLSDGIIELRRGEGGRTIEVLKQRGHQFQPGRHSISIGPEGMSVHPRLNPAEKKDTEVGAILSSGIPQLDELLGGGIAEQTITMFSGPSGVGKTTLGLQFMKEAAGRGKKSILYSFEEETGTILHRCSSINLPVREMVEQDTLQVRQFRPWSFDEGLFVDRVRRDVEEGAQIVMIDSISSYQACGPPERMRAQLHRLCKYLIEQGLTVLLVNEIRDITGTFRATEGAVSHLADNLIFLRYLEIEGELRKAIGILKKRAGNFEKTLREFRISKHGIRVGEPLFELRGVLTGNPEWTTSQNGGGSAGSSPDAG